MSLFTPRIPAIGPLVGSVLFWSASAIGCAAVLLVLVGIPADLSAQTVFPSQVTPPTLRPPAAGSGVLTAPGAEDLRVLPGIGTKKKRSKVFDRTNETTGNTGVSRKK
jgi:hypothetical protein